MASTVAGRQLTERQRRQQIAIRALTLRQVLALWPTFDITAIDESWAAMEPALLAVIQANRQNSAEVAAEYYRAFRMAEGVPGRVVPTLAVGDEWRQRAAVSLRVTGPFTAKRLVALNHPNPTAVTLTRLSGAVTRSVLDGGRETLVDSVREEERQTGRRVGWARVTSGDPCHFCAMLASRGPVYGERTADFQAHDHCSCSVEPTFSGSSEWPGRAREFQQQWREATRDVHGGPESIRAFRRVYEGRT